MVCYTGFHQTVIVDIREGRHRRSNLRGIKEETKILLWIYPSHNGQPYYYLNYPHCAHDVLLHLLQILQLTSRKVQQKESIEKIKER